jgi:hypothetical protein
MKSKTIAAGVAIVASLLGQVQAGEVNNDGNFLLESCSAVVRFEDGDDRGDWKKTRDIWSCYAFVDGVLDTVEMIALASGGRNPYCFSGDRIQKRQIARVIVKYLRDHPQDLHIKAASLTLVAMTEAFPCEAVKPTKGRE